MANGIPPFPNSLGGGRPTVGNGSGTRLASPPARAYGVVEVTPQGRLQPLTDAEGRRLRSGDPDDKDPRERIAGGEMLPPNLGNEVIPHVFTFIGLQRSLAKVYYPSDEAIQDSWDNARYMLHYLPILECLEQRQRSTALLGWHLESDNPKSQREKDLCDNLTKIIRQIPRFMQYRESLLNALWYGRYANQQRFRWKQIDGKMRIGVDRWQPLHGDKLVFRYDDGSGDYNPDQVGIRVGTYYTEGQRLHGRWKIERLDKISTTYMGLGYFLETWERPMLALHRHKIEDGEYNEPTRAGRIHGVGIRDRIYWTWFQAVEAQAWLMEYLERSAFGIEIWSYPAGNPQAREQTYTAATERVGNGRTVVLVPIYPEMEALNKPVQRIEPGMAGVSALKEVLVEIFSHQIKRYILGQTLTTEAAGTGLGSNLASIHLDTYLQIIRYDATNLEETLTTDLVEWLKRYNFPEAASVPVRVKIETESPDVEGKLQAWERAYNMGCKLRSKDVMELIGAAPPEQEDEVLQHPAAEQQQQQRQARVLGGLTKGLNLFPAAVAGAGSGEQGAGGNGEQPPGAGGEDGGDGGDGGAGPGGDGDGKGPGGSGGSNGSITGRGSPTGGLGTKETVKPSRPFKGFGGKRYGKDGKRRKYAAGWDESKHPRDESGEFSEKGGEPVKKKRLPASHKEAAALIADSVAEKIARRPEAHKDAPSKEQIQRNWEKNLKGRFSGLSPQRQALVDTAVSDNESNDVFQSVVKANHPDRVVFMSKGSDSPKSAAGESIGGVTVLYDDPLMNTNASSSGSAKPGTASSGEFGGLAAELRHEYAHTLFDATEPDVLRSIFEGVPEADQVKKDLTHYAGMNAARGNRQEVYSELFALVTDKNYNPEAFPAWIREAGQKLLASVTPKSKYAADALPGGRADDRPDSEHYNKSDSPDSTSDRWITIGGQPEGDAEHAGGTPVKIDSAGNIVAGPKWLAEKGIKRIGGDGAAVGDKPTGAKTPETAAVASQSTESKPPRKPKSAPSPQSNLLNPRSRLGKAVLSAAADNSIAPDDLADAVNYLWERGEGQRQHNRQRQRALEAARKLTGLYPTHVRKLKNAGYDHTSAKNVGGVLGQRLAYFDQFAQEVAREYPELGLGSPDDPQADLAAGLWDILDSDRFREESIDDPDTFAGLLQDAVGLAVADKGESGGAWEHEQGGGPDAEGEDVVAGKREGDDDFEFPWERFKRGGEVEKFRKWRRGKRLTEKFNLAFAGAGLAMVKYAKRKGGKPAAGQGGFDWDESKHPRDDEGKFSEKEGVGAGVALKVEETPGHFAGKFKVGDEYFTSRKAAESHLRKLQSEQDMPAKHWLEMSAAEQRRWASENIAGWEKMGPSEQRQKIASRTGEFLAEQRKAQPEKTLSERWAESADRWNSLGRQSTPSVPPLPGQADIFGGVTSAAESEAAVQRAKVAREVEAKAAAEKAAAMNPGTALTTKPKGSGKGGAKGGGKAAGDFDQGKLFQVGEQGGLFDRVQKTQERNTNLFNDAFGRS